jgi:hypothetical protein
MAVMSGIMLPEPPILMVSAWAVVVVKTVRARSSIIFFIVDTLRFIVEIPNQSIELNCFMELINCQIMAANKAGFLMDDNLL